VINCFTWSLASYFLVTYFHFSCVHVFFPFLFTSPLSFPLRTVPLRFQAGFHKRQLNLGLELCLFCVIVRFYVTDSWLIICVFALAVVFVVYPCFDFLVPPYFNEMTYFVSSEMLTLTQSVNQSVHFCLVHWLPFSCFTLRQSFISLLSGYSCRFHCFNNYASNHYTTRPHIHGAPIKKLSHRKNYVFSRTSIYIAHYVWTHLYQQR